MYEDGVQVAAAQSALLVIDMQNDFCDPMGYYAHVGRDISALRETIEPVQSMLERARTASIPVVFTRLVHDAEHGPMERRHRLPPRRWTARGNRLEPGSWGAEIISSLVPQSQEFIVDKATYSAFHGTALNRWLQDRGVTTLLLTGVVSYACLLATAFAAFDHGFDVVVVSDAVGSWESDLVVPTLAIVDLLLGYAVESDRIVIEQGQRLTRAVSSGREKPNPTEEMD